MLSEAKPPRDFTAPQIENWFKAICTSPDEKAVKLSIERIDIEKTTDIKIKSNLMSVVSTVGCGSQI